MNKMWKQIGTSTVVNLLSALAAIAAAGIAAWQTFEARSASDEAYKFALSSERLQSCMTMSSLAREASISAMFADLMDKPYRNNPRFILVAVAVSNLADEAVRFREMTPGKAGDQVYDASWELRIHLKDMVADGGDYLTQQEIQDSVGAIESLRRDICVRMLAPKDGF